MSPLTNELYVLWIRISFIINMFKASVFLAVCLFATAQVISVCASLMQLLPSQITRVRR